MHFSRNLTKAIIISLIYLISLLIILLLATFFGLRRIPDSAQRQNNRLVPIYLNAPIIQTITPNHNGLNLVMVFLRNQSLLNTDKLIFSLSSNNNVQLRKLEISGRNIGDGENIRFQFPPLSTSENQTYLLKLEAPETRIGQNKIEAGFSNQDVYLLGSSPVQPGDLTFELYYRPQSPTKIIYEVAGLFIQKITPLGFWLSVGFYLLAGYFFARLIYPSEIQ